MTCNVLYLIRELLRGFANLGAAARGTLQDESEEIRKIRQEMEERAAMSDRQRLHLDKENYVQDHRRAFEKMAMNYG